VNSYTRSIIAGFAATVVLSAIMVLKGVMGLMPQLNVVAMLAHMIGSGGPPLGWLAHFLIGTVVWGVLFALLYPSLPGPEPVVKGMVFAVGPWLLMMIIVMPLAGAGFFGLKLGIMAPVMTLLLHLIWGAALGLIYKALPGAERPAGTVAGSSIGIIRHRRRQASSIAASSAGCIASSIRQAS